MPITMASSDQLCLWAYLPFSIYELLHEKYMKMKTLIPSLRWILVFPNFHFIRRIQFVLLIVLRKQQVSQNEMEFGGFRCITKSILL